MILASIHHDAAYLREIKGITEGLSYLASGEWKGLAPGRYPIDGDAVYALVQAYETTPAAEGRMEAHQRYLDIQFVAEGREIIEAAPVDGLAVTQAYDPDKDVLFVADPACPTALYLGAGDYAVFFPQDAHKPHCHVDGKAGRVLKVVVKVRV